MIAPPASYTAIFAQPVRYVVVVGLYWNEDKTRYATAHELFHVLFAEAGIPQDEERVDDAAYCFGSAAVRNVLRKSVDCNELLRKLAPVTREVHHESQ